MTDSAQIRIGLHLFVPDGDLTAGLAALVSRAERVFGAGFDLVSLGEHHGSTPGYLPTAWSVAGALLASSQPERRVGVYPLLAGLRVPAMAAEEVSVAAALHPGQLSIALAQGYAALDLELCEATEVDRSARTTRAASLLAADDLPANLLLAGAGYRTVAEAADLGCGLLLPPLAAIAEAEVLQRWRDHGGSGPVVAQRWFGADPAGASLYDELAAPWRPIYHPLTTPSDLTSVLDDAAAGGVITEVSVRLGSVDSPPADLERWLDLAREGLARWRTKQEVVTVGN